MIKSNVEIRKARVEDVSETDSSDHSWPVKLVGSTTCKTLLKDGKVLAIMGILFGDGPMAEVWAMVSDAGRKSPILLSRTAAVMMDHIFEEYALERVQAWTFVGKDKNKSWMEWMGFEVEGIMRKFKDGEDCYLLSRVA